MLHYIEAYFKAAQRFCRLLRSPSPAPGCKVPGQAGLTAPAPPRGAGNGSTAGPKGNRSLHRTLLQLLLHFLRKTGLSLQSSLLLSKEQYSGGCLFGFYLFPLRCLESIFGLPRKFQVSCIKYLTGIFFLLSRCLFNITFDILSFTDGNRSRMGGLKITCQGDGRLEIGWGAAAAPPPSARPASGETAAFGGSRNERRASWCPRSHRWAS